MGHSGGGMFPLTLSPVYQRLKQVIRENRITNFTKSSTFEKYAGNFRPWNPLTWKYIQPIGSDGLLNAYGLTNQGVDVNAPAIASELQAEFRVIPNFYPQFANGREPAINQTIEAIKIYSRFMGPDLWALELNFSCPNSREKIKENMEDALACVKTLKRACLDLCLIAKISYVHPYEFAQELVRAGVDVIHAINTIPYDLVYPNNRPSPLQAVGGGGVSGGPAFNQALQYNKGLREATPNTSIIMGCGVMSLYNADRYFDHGANAVSLCTVCRLNPLEAERIIEEYAA
ncbi:hypothetical protein A3H09_02945 [Candidatus Falkowbacteria bacterium RIFCSPLOWO2_12_FULL_45_13]|nr:MAG: hypothetical protein A3H09_02945 [Candidatus Falkowbacteria bacterium RIFCSPLOWO2_12_FULL_45_13]